MYEQQELFDLNEPNPDTSGASDLSGLARYEQLRAAADASADVNGGKKLDARKPMFACLDPRGLMEVGQVAAYGAALYGDENWKLVTNGKRRYIDAAFRHLLKSFWERNDPESHVPHLAVAAWNCLAANWFQREEASNAQE